MMSIVNKNYLITPGILTMIFVLAVESCKYNPTSPTLLPESRPFINAQDYQNLILRMTDYDVIQITHKAGIDIRSPNIIRIEIGTKEVGSFNILLTSISSYDSTAHDYNIHFDYTIRMDSSKITAPVTVRYYKSDSTYFDADTMIALYKYPYQSAQVFLDSSQLGIDAFKMIIQGISLSGSNFFFHPLNEGFYSYDLVAHTCEERWDGYHIGSHLAADSNYVFCDVDHQQIVRYNLTTDKADSSVPYLGKVQADIAGMAIVNHLLYVLITDWPIYLKKFTLNGVLLDSIPMPTNSSYKPFFMAMHDSVVYSKEEISSGSPRGGQISRFDLRTKSFLSNVASPAKEIEPITISGDLLYYNNFYKNFIGVMPVADLVPVQSIAKQSTFQRFHSHAPNHFREDSTK